MYFAPIGCATILLTSFSGILLVRGEGVLNSARPSDSKKDASPKSSWCKDKKKKFYIKSPGRKQMRCKRAALNSNSSCNIKEVKENCPVLCFSCHLIDNHKRFEIIGFKENKIVTRRCANMKKKKTKITQFCSFASVKSNCPRMCDSEACPGILESSIKSAVKMATNGYALPPGDPEDYRELIPFHNNWGETPVFDMDKLAEHLSKNFRCETDNKFTDIIESKISEFAHKLSISVQVSGKDKFLGNTVEANAASIFDLTTQQTTETFASQRTNIIHMGFAQLPYDGNKSLIQALMYPSCLKDLKNIADQKDRADSFVAQYGIGYISDLTLGGHFKMTSLVKKEFWMTKENIGTSISASYSGAVASEKTKIEVKIQNEDKTEISTSIFTLDAYGGDPLLTSDEKGWIESIKKNLVIISYKLFPVYELLDETSVSYSILKDAVSSAVEKFGSNIPGFDYKPTLLGTFPPVKCIYEAVLPFIINGKKAERDVYCANDPPPGYLMFGHGILLEREIIVARIDGTYVVENDDYDLVWFDKKSGWSKDYYIWVPTSTNPYFHPMGFVVSNKHNEKPEIKVAMVHISLCQSPLFPTSPWYISKNNIGGKYHINLYENLWGNFGGQLTWDSNLMVTNPTFPPPYTLKKPLVAPYFEKFNVNV